MATTTKLIKITLEYEDCIKTLSGDDVSKYNKFLEDCITFCYHHHGVGGIRLDKDFNWKIEPKELTDAE